MVSASFTVRNFLTGGGHTGKLILDLPPGREARGGFAVIEDFDGTSAHYDGTDVTGQTVWADIADAPNANGSHDATMGFSVAGSDYSMPILCYEP